VNSKIDILKKKDKKPYSIGNKQSINYVLLTTIELKEKRGYLRRNIFRKCSNLRKWFFLEKNLDI